MKSLIEQEKILFNDWTKKRKAFSPDGIIDEESYLNSDPKLLFLLKEVNTKEGKKLDLKDFIRNGGRRQTWDNIARWVYGIRNIHKNLEWNDIEKIKTIEQRKEILKSICVINLKKSPGIHTTNNSQLWEVAEEDKYYLNRQFKIYFDNIDSRPNLIIACGSITSSTFNELVSIPDKRDWIITSRGIWYCEFEKGRYFIEFAHPEARVQDCLLFYGLIDAVRELTIKNAI